MFSLISSGLKDNFLLLMNNLHKWTENWLIFIASVFYEIAEFAGSGYSFVLFLNILIIWLMSIYFCLIQLFISMYYLFIDILIHYYTNHVNQPY